MSELKKIDCTGVVGNNWYFENGSNEWPNDFETLDESLLQCINTYFEGIELVPVSDHEFSFDESLLLAEEIK